MTRHDLPLRHLIFFPEYGVVMRLSVKLPLAAAGLAVFSIAATSLASLTVSGSMSSQAAVEKLEALADARRNELRHYLTTIENDLRNLQGQKTVAMALSDLSSAMAGIGSGAAGELAQRYVTANPNAEDKRALLSSAGKDKYDDLQARPHDAAEQRDGRRKHSNDASAFERGVRPL
nr:hypothetical protein [Ensifer sp. IC4062]